MDTNKTTTPAVSQPPAPPLDLSELTDAVSTVIGTPLPEDPVPHLLNQQLTNRSRSIVEIIRVLYWLRTELTKLENAIMSPYFGTDPTRYLLWDMQYRAMQDYLTQMNLLFRPPQVMGATWSAPNPATNLRESRKEKKKHGAKH